MNERFSASNLADMLKPFRIQDRNKGLVLQGLVDDVDLRQLRRVHSTLHEGSVRRLVAEIKAPMVLAEVIAGTVEVHDFPGTPLARLDAQESRLWAAEAVILDSAVIRNQFGNDTRLMSDLEEQIFAKWGVKKGDYRMLRAVAFGGMAIKRGEKFLTEFS